MYLFDLFDPPQQTHTHPRELLNAHKDNLGTMVKLVIFNELSNARNPNNMQTLHTLLQHSPEQAPKVSCPASRSLQKATVSGQSLIGVD